MRIQNDPSASTFANWLLDIGHGRFLSNDEKTSIPPSMQAGHHRDLIDFVYAGITQNPPPSPQFFLDRMILAPRNADVAATNEEILHKLSGEPVTFYSADTVATDHQTEQSDAANIPVEYLRSLNSGNLPPGELNLKVGCPVILLRNLSASIGLCNGTRLIISRMSSRVIEARILGGDHDGELVLIPRISLTQQESLAETPFRLSRRQFPLRLAFSLTINKSQGQTVKWVGLDVRVPVFGHGQLYVALSRATSQSTIKVLAPEDSDHNKITNIVYPEVLLT